MRELLQLIGGIQETVGAHPSIGGPNTARSILSENAEDDASLAESFKSRPIGPKYKLGNSTGRQECISTRPNRSQVRSSGKLPLNVQQRLHDFIGDAL